MATPHPLQSRTFTGKADGPHLLITGGVHGDEYEPMAAIRRLIQHFAHENAPGLRGRLTLVPVVNEPAFVRNRRTAEDEKDLARTCPGRIDGTITERIADGLSTLIRTADFYIDLHTGGTIYDIMPLSGYVMHTDAAVLEKQRGMSRAFNLPLIWGTTPNLDGRSLSIARDAKIPAIYSEHGGGASLRPEGVRDYADGCLNVMAFLKMIDRAAPVSRVQHVVEDTREQSGHLQIQNPSPSAGFFEAHVRVGDWVKQGQVIGEVSDLLGERVAPVRALQTGLVNLVRTVPQVKKDDALVSILEIGQVKEGVTWRIG